MSNRRNARNADTASPAFSWLSSMVKPKHVVVASLLTGVMLMGSATLAQNRTKQLLLGLGLLTTGVAAARPSFIASDQPDISNEASGWLVCLGVVGVVTAGSGALAIADSATLQVEDQYRGVVYTRDNDFRVEPESISILPKGFHLKSPFKNEGTALLGRPASPIAVYDDGIYRDVLRLRISFRFSAQLDPEKTASLIDKTDGQINVRDEISDVFLKRSFTYLEENHLDQTPFISVSEARVKLLQFVQENEEEFSQIVRTEFEEQLLDLGFTIEYFEFDEILVEEVEVSWNE